MSAANSIELRQHLPQTGIDAATNTALNKLFAAAWENHQLRDFRPVLQHSLVWITAHARTASPPDTTVGPNSLVGFVNVAWDGGLHAFLLDPTVHPDRQRQGIGRALVMRAAEAARTRGLHWLHVDYAPHLHEFYSRCGFRPTAAGLLALCEAT